VKDLDVLVKDLDVLLKDQNVLVKNLNVQFRKQLLFLCKSLSGGFFHLTDKGCHVFWKWGFKDNARRRFPAFFRAARNE
jgi:hypothetical protein